MKNGEAHRLPNGEYQVILTEGGIELCVTYAVDEGAAEKIIKEWREGSYKLLHG